MIFLGSLWLVFWLLNLWIWKAYCVVAGASPQTRLFVASAWFLAKNIKGVQWQICVASSLANAWFARSLPPAEAAKWFVLYQTISAQKSCEWHPVPGYWQIHHFWNFLLFGLGSYLRLTVEQYKSLGIETCSPPATPRTFTNACMEADVLLFAPLGKKLYRTTLELFGFSKKGRAGNAYTSATAP